MSDIKLGSELRGQKRPEEERGWRGVGSAQAPRAPRAGRAVRGDPAGGGRRGLGGGGQLAGSLTRLSTVSTMSLLLTSPTCMSPINTANFIRMLRIGTEGLIIPAGSTTAPEPDAPLGSPVPLPPPAPTAMSPAG